MGGMTAKLIAVLVILICLAVGAVGLVLPIVPGLLFLLIAALVAARYSPRVDRMLRRNRTISGYLDSTDGFAALPVAKKIQFGALLCLKMLIDGIALVISTGARLLRVAMVNHR
jgi:uncharacterized membrane protein YbaN (DUF454 family)